MKADSRLLENDIRCASLFREAEALYRAIRQPGSGQISDACELDAAPDGQRAVFAGTLMDQLESTASTRICHVDLATGDTRVLTFGPNTDRLPKYSPDGRHIAFLSDRGRAGDFQLYLLDPETGLARPTTAVDGWVEYFHWSPDGKRILLAVAGHGADVAGGQGAVTSKQAGEALPSWVPLVETGEESYRWRRAWVYELATHQVRQVTQAKTNVWEAVWCGNESLCAVVSPGPGEGLWYSATLQTIDLNSGEAHEIYKPNDQLGWPASSPSGKSIAIVEALCSDRWFVAGDLHIIERSSGKRERADTRGVDVTYTEWRSDRALLLAGHRGFETVVGLYDLTSKQFTEVWRSQDTSIAGRYASVSGFNETGDCLMIAESFVRPPEIVVLSGGKYHAVRSFAPGYAEVAKAIASVERVTWKASDGLEIQGWLLKPEGPGPYPTVLNVHGGPVWQYRPAWLGRGGAATLMLLKRGYAALLANPRGSSGRGQVFVRHELGDLGGAETQDHLSGLDYLVEAGIADPNRIGVIGVSHGGFMSAWLITQDSRFAAAVPVAPVTNYVTQQLIGNIPQFETLFLADHYTNPGGKYFQRSPIMHAHKTRTPTLNICGALDRCTPPEEAVQFHNALLENKVESVLVIYPEEGHGVRKFPAMIDFAARVVGWFTRHMPNSR